MMMNGEEYLKSLKEMKTVVYINGNAISDYYDHPVMKPAVNTLKATYDLASDPGRDPELHSLLVTDSDLTKGRINRFLKIIRSQDDLLARMKLQRAMMRYTGGCFGGRCVSGAVIHALWSVTYEVDRESSGKTSYHERFRNYMKIAQEKDLAISGNITDAKGDRSLPPHRQADPDHPGRLRQHVDVLFAVGIPELGVLGFHDVDGNVAPAVSQELQVALDSFLC